MSEKIIIVNVTNCPKADWETLKKYEANNLKKDFKDEKRDVSILKNAIINRGFNFPLYIWDEHQYIIDGAGRMKALLELESEGYTIPELPIVTVKAESFEQAKHLVLQASSQHGEITQASFDAFVADINIDDLIDSISIPDVKLPGAVGGANEPEGDPDEPIDPPEDPVTVTGDIYEIGPHRLICGDSTVITDVEKVMNGQLADMVCTDPPYNVDYTGKTKDALKIENDKKDDASFFQFLYDVYVNLFAVSKEGAAIYVFHADSEGMNFRKAMLDAGWLLKQCCIWVKNVMVMGRQDYHWQHEPVLYGWKPGASHNWYTDRKQTTVWNFDRPSRNEEHPTMKPIDLICYPIMNSSQENGLVVDFFLGSGSTMVAAHTMGRTCYGLEMDPRYCDVIVKRMKKLFPNLEIKRNGIAIEKL